MTNRKAVRPAKAYFNWSSGKDAALAYAEKLDESFVGREIDDTFVDDLPPDVDPCGENGEFHTFCYDGPIFKVPIKFVKGEKILRQYEVVTKDDTQSVGFWFLDLIPG